MRDFRKIKTKLNKAKSSGKWRIAAFLIGIVVAFTTTYSLILPAITVDTETAEEMNGLVIDTGLQEETVQAYTLVETDPTEEVSFEPEEPINPEEDLATDASDEEMSDIPVETTSASTDEVQTEADENETFPEVTEESVITESGTAGEDTAEAETDKEDAKEAETAGEKAAEEDPATEDSATEDPPTEDSIIEETAEAYTSEEAATQETSEGTIEGTISEDTESEIAEETTSKDTESATTEETTSEETESETAEDGEERVVSPLIYQFDDFDLEVRFDGSVSLPEGTTLQVKELTKENLSSADLKPEEYQLYSEYFRISEEEMQKLRAQELSASVLYELSFENEDGAVLLPDLDYEIRVIYHNEIQSHSEEIIRAALYYYDESCNVYKAQLVQKNLDETPVVLMDEKDAIKEIDFKDVSFSTYDTVIGLFAGKEQEEVLLQETIFEAVLDNVSVDVTAPYGVFPEGTTMEVLPVQAQEVLDAIQDTVEAAGDCVTAVDIIFRDADGNEIQPEKEIKVSIRSSDIQEYKDPVLLHIDDAGVANVVDDVTLGEEEVSFESRDYSIYVIVGTTIEETVLASDGISYRIEVTYGADAGIPDGAVLHAEELVAGEEGYDAYVAGTADAIGSSVDELSHIRIFDIHIEDSHGGEIEPSAPVEVRIEYAYPVQISIPNEIQIFHFGEESTDIIEPETNRSQYGIVDEFTFETTSFSCYSVVSRDNPTDLSGGSYALVTQGGNCTPWKSAWIIFRQASGDITESGGRGYDYHIGGDYFLVL